MFHLVSRRARIAILTLLTAVLGIVGVVAPTAAQAAAAVGYGASTAHPYSDPTSWPLATPAAMGCYHTNCGGTDHSTYLWDIVGENSANNQPVFAMGAGIVHIGATGQGCGHAQSRGNFVYVDHGNGLLTYYGHLGRILVRNGEYVSPRTALAYMGNSGYARCHTYPKLRYLMVAEKTGGTGGRYVEIPHTYACATNGSRVSWPQQLPSGRASHWDAVRNKTSIPAASSSRSCISVPTQTATRPAITRTSRSSRYAVTAGWNRSWTGFGVGTTVVTLSMYHPTAKHWRAYRVHWLSGAATATTFTKLHKKRHYAVTIQVHNAWGWSATSTRYAYVGK